MRKANPASKVEAWCHSRKQTGLEALKGIKDENKCIREHMLRTLLFLESGMTRQNRTPELRDKLHFLEWCATKENLAEAAQQFRAVLNAPGDSMSTRHENEAVTDAHGISPPLQDVADCAESSS